MTNASNRTRTTHGKSLLKAPKLDYGYMETEAFKIRFSDPVKRKQMKKNWKLMHPALDKSLGKILEAFEQHMHELFTQPQVSVISLACGEADELSALWKFFAQREVMLNFIGVEQHQGLLETTRHKFRNFTNQQFITADATNLDFLASHPLTANTELRAFSSTRQHSNIEDRQPANLKELFGNTDLVIIRHPNLTSSLGQAFQRMITEVAPAFLRPGGLLLITMYFEKEKNILDNIIEDANETFVRLKNRTQNNVPSRTYDGELQKLDHHQCLLQKKSKNEV